MLDIIFFAIVAVFIAFRLRSVLGQKNDADEDRILRQKAQRQRKPEVKGEVIDFPGKNNNAGKVITVEPQPVFSQEINAGIAAIAAADKDFSVPYFLDGAKKAFEMILKAYVQEDERTLKNLLTKEVYDDFYQDIENQRKNNEKRDVTLVSVVSAEVTAASLLRSNASVTVTFMSEQIIVTRQRETNEIIEGNASKIEKVEDVWTFTRSMRSSNPNWKLSSTS